MDDFARAQTNRLGSDSGQMTGGGSMGKAAPSPLMRGGKREKNKREKLFRIKKAAAELFTERGFDAATTEDIARRARVAKGTLFLYARDKRDLVFLIFKDEITKVSKKAFEQAVPEDSLLDQLCCVAAGFYKGFLKNPQLSKILLAELFFYRGKLAREFYEDRQRVIERYERILSQAKSAGKLAADIETSMAAEHVFLLISGALRIWLGGEKPNVDRGIERLRHILSLSVRNMAVRAGEPLAEGKSH